MHKLEGSRREGDAKSCTRVERGNESVENELLTSLNIICFIGINDTTGI
jgi:hypothetical protein